MSYRTKTLSLLAAPIILFFAGFSWPTFSHFLGKISQKNSEQCNGKSRLDVALSLVVPFLFFGNLKLTTSAAECVECIFLTDDLNMWLCYEDNQMKNAILAAIGIVSILMYSILFPCKLIHLFNKSDINLAIQNIKKNYQQILEDEFTGAQDLKTRNLYTRYGNIFLPFRYQTYWWSLILFVKRFLIALILLIYKNNSMKQMRAISSIISVSLIAHLIFRPFEHDDLMNERKSNSADESIMQEINRMIRSPNTLNMLAHGSIIATALGASAVEVNDASSWAYRVVYNGILASIGLTLFTSIKVMMTIYFQSDKKETNVIKPEKKVARIRRSSTLFKKYIGNVREVGGRTRSLLLHHEKDSNSSRKSIRTERNILIDRRDISSIDYIIPRSAGMFSFPQVKKKFTDIYSAR
jgi:hypothetical protein